ncbi:hypothetical protein [Mycobacterium leprae]|uniref:hypothetical protein n=1 Tax=Mycobacterium leprae TaxID=1769 RepID=UPI0013A5FF64|nr:hypothetical protein [Mycobacterium leprae]
MNAIGVLDIEMRMVIHVGEVEVRGVVNDTLFPAERSPLCDSAILSDRGAEVRSLGGN